MNPNIAASFLRSGRTLANAANAAAVVAGVACFISNPAYTRILLAGSILLWFVECYYAMRVAIDASLFRAMSVDADAVARDLDAFLKRSAGRPLQDRTRGALELWRRQIAALVVQLATLFAAIVLRLANL